jgi:heme-degrading monooxygenase HmoA
MAQIVTMFDGKVRAGVATEYRPLASEIRQRARRTDGFVSYKSFTADDGEHLSVAVFESPETHAAWRGDEMHREAQRRGCTGFYSEYDVFVGEVVRRGHWQRNRTGTAVDE